MSTLQEIEQVKRRRALVQAMQQHGPPQGQMAGRFYVAPSGVSQLAYLAQALGGAYADRKLAKKEGELTTQRGKELSDALRGVIGTPNAQQEAAIAMVGGLDPKMQENVVGRAALGALEPQKPAEGFTLSEGQHRFDASGKTVATVPKGETENVRTLRALMGDPALAMVDQRQRAAGATNVTVNTEKNLYGTMADAQGKANVELFGQAQKAPELFQRAQRVKQQLNSAAITGAGANWLLAGAKVANQMGINTGNAASDTEVLARDLAAATLDGIKASGLGGGSGFSNADRDFLEKVVGGKITLERDTLQRLANLNEKSAIKTIERWNAAASRLDPNQLKTLGMSQIKLPKGMVPQPTAQPQLIQNADGSMEYRP